MLPKIGKLSALALICSGVMLWAPAYADPLLDEVHTVAASTVAVPVEHSFTISSSGTYQVTLTDLGAALPTPAPLGTVKLAITSGSTLVSLTPTGGTAATELTAAGSATFTGSPGTYIVHVIGTPGSGTGSGPIGIAITNTSNNSQIAAYSDTLALPQSTSTSSNQAVLDDSFSVVTTGTYQVTLTDMQLPQSLTKLTLAIVQEAGSLVGTLSVTEPGTSTSADFTLTEGVTYRIFAVGQQLGTPTAGLYGVNVMGAQSVYNKTVAVGSVALLGAPTLTAGTATLTLADLQYPNGTALSSSGAAVTLNGQSVVTPLTTPGSTTFTATATAYQVWGIGVPPSSTTPGSYAVTLTTAAGTPVLDIARAVSSSTSSPYTYSYDTSFATAGTYTLDLTDFAYPTTLSSVTVAVVQGGKRVGSALSTAGVAGSGSATLAAGSASVLAFATLGTSATGGLFGVDLTASGASSPSFEMSQGVGQLFSLHQVTVATGGSYQISVTDVGFPASFENLTVIVTRGSNNVTQVVGGGSQIINATAGTYDVNVVAQPGGSDSAGTYAITFDTAPPVPTVTLSSSATSVNSGGTVTLTWSSTNATSCSLSGGGFSSTSESTSGSVTSSAITSSTTFSMTCTGAGGTSSPQTVTVTVIPSLHGGGGAIGADALALLLGLVLLRIVIAGQRWRVLPGAR
jgi:hypothetical protein